MITTSHVLLSLAVLDRSAVHKTAYWQQADRRFALWCYSLAIVAGALLPDIAMFVFYGYEKAMGFPEAQIWGEHYYLPGWQALFDVFNSAPLMVLGLLISGWQRSPLLGLLFLSMLLHVAFDLPLHNDDAHGHFWPLSNWRFISPLSYWDPAHHGQLMSRLELLLVVICSVVLLWRYQLWSARLAVALLLVGYLGFGLFAVLVWS